MKSSAILFSLLLSVGLLQAQKEVNALSVDSILHLAQSYYNINLDSSLHYSYKAYEKALKTKDVHKIAKSIGYTSTYLLSQKKHQEAIGLLQYNLDHQAELKPEDLGVTLNNLGVIYHLREDDDQAIVYYLKALEVFEQINHLKQLARVNLNLGIVYEKEKRLKQSEYFYSASMRYAKMGKSAHADRLYEELKEETESTYELNVQMAKDALEEIEDPVNSRLAGVIYHDLSENHLSNGAPLLAIEAAQNAIHAKENSRFTQNLDHTYYLLGKGQLDAGQVQQSVYNLKKALDLSVKQELKLVMYDALIDALVQKESYKEALSFVTKKTQLRDSLDLIVENENIARITAQFENEKQANKILVLEKEARQKELLLAQNELKVWRWLLVALLAVGFAIWLMRRNWEFILRLRQVESEKEAIIKKVEKAYLELNNKSKVYLDELTYVKSDGNYLEFYHNGERIMDRNKLKTVLEELPPNFVRVHKSYIINKNYVQAHNSAKVILKPNIEIPLSRTYKSNLSA